MHREVVQQTLRELGSKHMARAAAAKIAGDARDAAAAYELADAFAGADEELHFIETDEEGNALPRERLASNGPTGRPTEDEAAGVTLRRPLGPRRARS